MFGEFFDVLVIRKSKDELGSRTDPTDRFHRLKFFVFYPQRFAALSFDRQRPLFLQFSLPRSENCEKMAVVLIGKSASKHA